MENHPFGVRDDEDMEALVESIRQYGVLNPIIVRERRQYGDNYEIVSGHRRYEACKRLGKFDIPVIVRDHRGAGEYEQGYDQTLYPFDQAH